MPTASELRELIKPHVTEAFGGISGKDAAMAALGIFSVDEFKAEQAVGAEMKKLAKQYERILQTITGIKKGWTVSATTTLLSIDNEDAGIVIDITWKGNAITKKVDVVVDMARREGPEKPGAKWRNKVHMVRDIVPTTANLSPRKIIADQAVRSFLKESAEELLAPLTEDGGWHEVDAPPRAFLAEAKMDPYAQKVKKALDGLARTLPKVLQGASKGGIPWKLEPRHGGYSPTDGLYDGIYFQHDARVSMKKGVVTSPGGRPYVSVSQWGDGEDEFAVRIGLDFEESGTTNFLEDNSMTTDEAVRALNMKAPAIFKRWLSQSNFTYTMPESVEEAGAMRSVGMVRTRSGQWEDSMSAADELRAIIEGKPRGPVKGGGQGYWSREEKKGELKKKERRSKRKEIQQQLRGEGVETLDESKRFMLRTAKTIAKKAKVKVDRWGGRGGMEWTAEFPNEKEFDKFAQAASKAGFGTSAYRSGYGSYVASPGASHEPSPQMIDQLGAGAWEDIADAIAIIDEGEVVLIDKAFEELTERKGDFIDMGPIAMDRDPRRMLMLTREAGKSAGKQMANNFDPVYVLDDVGHLTNKSMRHEFAKGAESVLGKRVELEKIRSPRTGKPGWRMSFASGGPDVAMKADARTAQVAFNKLKSALRQTKLPTEKGDMRQAGVDEFMLMNMAQGGSKAMFKHGDTRNYVILDMKSGKLDVPRTSKPFFRGYFDVFESIDESGRGMGPGGMGKGPGGDCVCPSCGATKPHTTGEACMDMTCPKCGAKMTREDVNDVTQLRSLIEYKGTPYGKSHGSKEADLWGSEHGEKKYVGSKRRSGHSKQAKKMAHKGERQAARKEIQARMRGEEEDLYDLGTYLELIEAMASDEEPVKPVEPVQLRNLQTIQQTAQQLGRFTTEFATYLKKAMRSKEVDVARLGRFGRQVDAAHRIFKDTYRKLALGMSEAFELEDDVGGLEEGSWDGSFVTPTARFTWTIHEYKLEELPQKGKKRLKVSSMQNPWGIVGHGRGAPNDFIANNIIMRAKLSKTDNFDRIKDKLDREFKNAIEVAKRDHTDWWEKNSWLDNLRWTDDSVHYLKVVPEGTDPIVAKGRDFTVNSEWTKFSAYDPGADFHSHDPSYTQYASKSPAAARKLYKILKADPKALARLSWGDFRGWLNKNKIAFDTNFSSWR